MNDQNKTKACTRHTLHMLVTKNGTDGQQHKSVPSKRVDIILNANTKVQRISLVLLGALEN